MTQDVAIYARVSTSQQAQAQTIEQQLERLRAHVAGRGWSLDETHVFRDDGHSGAGLNRPGLDRLRDATRLGEVDLILVTEPDRLARNYVHQMILLDEFERAGCPVEFLDRPMGDDPHDRLLLQIRGAVAEYERTLIADRLRRGRQMKYRAGVLLPWTHPLYGYDFDPGRPRDPAGVRVDEAEAAVVREIYARYATEGVSLCRLAEDLGRQGIPTPGGKRIWSLCTLRSILRQPAYTGRVYANRFAVRPARIRRSATHPIGRPHDSLTELPPEEWIAVTTIPAIVTPEQFELVRGKLAQNRSFAARNAKYPYLLRALVSCGRCRAACSGRHTPAGYSYYVCSGKRRAIHSRTEIKCPSRFSPADQLDALVWADLCEVLTHPEHLAAALRRAAAGQWLPQALQARREQLRRAQRQLDQQLERLTDAYLVAVFPLAEYERRRRELEQKRQGLARQEEQLAAQVDRQAEVAGMVRSVEAFCQRVRDGLERATFEQRRQLVELLIDRVLVADGEVEIRYVFPTSPSSESVRFCQLRSDYFGYPELVRRPGAEPPPHQVGRARGNGVGDGGPDAALAA
jgi:site-specific DNA recombinase